MEAQTNPQKQHNRHHHTIEQSHEWNIRTLKTIGEALRTESFPMDIQVINYTIGEYEIKDENGKGFPIRDLTDWFGKEEYDSGLEVLEEIRTSMRKKLGSLEQPSVT